jgi:anti-sigma-K factor RskA
MNHEEWLQRAEIYALGALDEEDLAQFESHLAAGCPQCKQRVRETGETLTLLPRSLAPAVPSPSVKEKLLDRIAAGVVRPMPVRPRSVSMRWGVGGGALAAGLLIALGWWLYTTSVELATLRNQLMTLQASVSSQEELVKFLSDPQARLISLSGLEPSPGAAARLVWNPITRRGFLLTSGLPQNPTDKAYELWAIAGKEPVPAGVFTVDERGHALLTLPPLPPGKSFDKFAVTLEPAGGAPQPTGAMYLLGSL